jgi:YidC/Oxa1 family membrane protein insertase
MLPIFKLIHKIIPNYGIAIIIFSLIIKLLLHPLSIKQLRSAQKMQLIAPEMNRLREEYKDDKQKQQQEIMKMYSQYGINPMGGCLPLILQLPILYALWAVLSKAIELRQTEFILWIHDLSIPDVIFSLPFRIPILNINQFSGLALLMGITLFLQQKMTITDPRQKSLVYIMPIMFTFMFSSLPSGLNLYYFMFNLMGIIQQVYINKYSKKKLTLEDLKRMPKKEGWFQKKMREAQEIAASQGKTLPGQNLQSNKPKYQRKKQQSRGKSGKK